MEAEEEDKQTEAGTQIVKHQKERVKGGGSNDIHNKNNKENVKQKVVILFKTTQS